MSEELVATLRKSFRYEPETGLLFWKEIAPRSGRIVGQQAGSLCPIMGYVQVHVAKRRLKAHRIIWGIVYGAMPTLQIDHINHIRHDNRISNLREATNTQNAWNKPTRSRSLPTGVDETSIGGKRFRARIKLHGKTVCLGFFYTAASAGEAYARAAAEIHRDFCCVPVVKGSDQSPVISYS